MISDLILTFCLAKAQLGIFDDRTIQNLKVVKDMKVVKTESAPVDGRIAVFEDIAIIEREINSFGEFKERPLTREPSLGLMVVQRSSDGRYGTSDGGIIVTVTKKSELSVLAADYGLRIMHIFGSLPMAILMPTDIGKSEALLDKLRDDPRVSNADLDVNFYDAEAL